VVHARRMGRQQPVDHDAVPVRPVPSGSGVRSVRSADRIHLRSGLLRHGEHPGPDPVAEAEQSGVSIDEAAMTIIEVMLPPWKCDEIEGVSAPQQ
jgi:hypothetical protein